MRRRIYETHVLSTDFDLEAFFDNFVASVGGLRVQDLVEVPAGVKNADYVFPDDQVILELKIFEAEFTDSVAFKKKRVETINRWFAEGKADVRWLTGAATEPDLDVAILDLLRKPIKERVAAANRQLRETKELLGMQDTAGVMIALNDGFYDIEPRATLYLLATALGDRMSSTDGFVHLNFRTKIVLPGDSRETFFWLKRLRDNENQKLAGFLDELGFLWWSYLEHVSGNKLTHRVFDPDPENTLMSGATYAKNTAVAFTGYRIVGNTIVDRKAAKVFRIDGQKIVSIDGQPTSLWIDDGYIFGSSIENSKFFIDHEGRIIGPGGVPPWEGEADKIGV